MTCKNVRAKRKQLIEMSAKLQEIALYEINWEKGQAIRKEQDKIYKRYKFFDGYIKAMEKVR